MSISTEFEQIGKLSDLQSPEISRLHDETVLSYFCRSIRFTAIPLFSVIVSFTVVLYLEFPIKWVFVWMVTVLLCQALRIYSSYKITDPAVGSLPRRMVMAQVVAFVTGCAIGSVCLFAPMMSVESRALISMILVGTAAASIATCLGYKRIYLFGTSPMLVSLLCMWCIDTDDQIKLSLQILVVLLTLQVCVVFYSLIGQIYGFFVSNLASYEKLQVAFESEREANTAKTRFLAAASHDLRQPLHAMSMFSGALVARPLDEQSQSLAGKINESIRALSEELDTLLDISRLDSKAVQVDNTRVDISQLVARIVDSFRPAVHQKGLAFNIHIEPDVITHTDVGLFTRMFRNLLDNAVKYTASGYVQCDLSTDNGFLVIKIVDTGEGISAEQKEHIWEEFYQVGNVARDRRLGLGLGLSVVSRIAVHLDAKVKLCDSSPDGSCFEIRMTQIGARLAKDSEAIAALEKPADAFMHGRTVLLIDDDNNIQTSTTALLTNYGARVISANNSADALALYRDHAVDCALVDLRLAGSDDGFDTIEKIRAIDKSAKLIVISGDTAPDRLIRARSLWCPWLVKPVKSEVLLAEFKRIFA